MKIFPVCSVRLLLALSMVIVWTTTANAYEVKEVKDGGVLSGVVTLSGERPSPEYVTISKDAETCGHGERVLPRLVGEAGAAANTVVVLKGVQAGKGFDEFTGPYVLNQMSCEFVPHVLIVPVGERLSIKNNDPILHNVHAFLNEETAFNVAMPLEGQVIRKKLKKPGFIRFQCDAGHVWMSAHVVVVEHPYVAVTDERGRYEIKGIPPGTYNVEFWHEGWKVEKTLTDGAIIYSPPVVSSAEVVIEANQKTELNSSLSVTSP
jgi:plastocyanin